MGVEVGSVGLLYQTGCVVRGGALVAAARFGVEGAACSDVVADVSRRAGLALSAVGVGSDV